MESTSKMEFYLENVYEVFVHARDAFLAWWRWFKGYVRTAFGNLKPIAAWRKMRKTRRLNSYTEIALQKLGEFYDEWLQVQRAAGAGAGDHEAGERPVVREASEDEICADAGDAPTLADMTEGFVEIDLGESDETQIIPEEKKEKKSIFKRLKKLKSKMSIKKKSTKQC